MGFSKLKKMIMQESTSPSAPQGAEVHPTVPLRDTAMPKEVFLSWSAEVPHNSNSMDPKLKKNLMIIGIVFALLFAVMQEFFLILVIASVFFMSYVFSTMAPPKVSYEVSNFGIKVSDIMYYWDELQSFFFTTKYGEELMLVDARDRMPKRIFIHFKKADREKLMDVLNSRVIYLESEPENFVDNFFDYIKDKFDFNRSSSK
ncbi:hypothetical protein KAZ57_01075 [Patescibacteria group bacterium]|nr:hypothetical protein [Patescibacteria group bacterium]